MICKHDPYNDLLTGIKSFDKKSDNGHEIMSGNCSTNVLFSMYIRSYDEIECNGFTKKPGEFRDFDLTPFRRNYRIPNIVQYALDQRKNEKLILYVIRTVRGEKTTIYGWIITTGYETDHQLILAVPARSPKARHIIDTCVVKLTGNDSPYSTGRVYNADEEEKVRERYKHDTELLTVALEYFYKEHPEKKPCSTPTNESSTTAELSPAAPSEASADA